MPPIKQGIEAATAVSLAVVAVMAVRAVWLSGESLAPMIAPI